MEERLDMQSPMWANKNSKFIAERFPNCVTETAEGIKIDFDLLQQELSSDIIEGNKERYRLEWPGKREAIVTANLPTTKTLRPVREDSVDFDNTENLYIEGDNLEVLKLLQESYLGKIKMIYIDPPYNTGKDFVYKDNFSKDAQEELIESGQKDEYNQRLVANPETAGRYHSDWLSMMYPRLKLARNLLSQDGVIFISIDDNEVHHLRKVCDEIFGEYNFVAQFIHKNNSNKNQANIVSVSCEYFLCYSRDIEVLNKEIWRIEKKGAKDIVKAFNQLKKQGLELDEVLNEIKDLYKRPKYAHLSRWNKIDEKGVFMDDNLSREGGAKDYTVINPDTGKPCPIPPRGWAKSKDELEKLLEDDMIYFGDPSTPPRIKSYLTGEDLSVPDSFWYIDNSIDTRWQKQTFNSLIFENPKPLELIRLIMEMSSAKDSIVLDFFSGSATSAHATMQLNSEDSGNRKFIQVQLPELTDEKSEAYKAGYKNICEIGKERIRRAAKKIKEETNAAIDYGFRVYRLDSSNMQDVYYKPQDYDQGNLDLFADNVKADRTAYDLLAQVMLDWGLPLSLKIEQVDVSGKKAFKVAENSLYACFDSGIDEDFAKAIAKDAPLRIVFKDSGFRNDTAKTNVKQLLKQLSPETEMKVL
ncbi:site-specific DNA-methyltransferase [Mangrovimonas sp. ST2L15]|uniref:site-specific DNA-methyltransferase n=1 Tax=Mangrovimonas sp. ST2L15 TaxID=1645916 RepID=UPI0006B539F6|nr:site-specific DNA-methyltransferase [Mangrovimonas sp. ST2L15]